MRMRPHYVQQPRQHSGPVAVLMLAAVGTVLVPMAVGVVVAVAVAVPMVVAVIMAVMRVAARNVHAIQDALGNAFSHVTTNTQMQYRRNNQWLKKAMALARTIQPCSSTMPAPCWACARPGS